MPRSDAVDPQQTFTGSLKVQYHAVISIRLHAMPAGVQCILSQQSFEGAFGLVTLSCGCAAENDDSLSALDGNGTPCHIGYVIV